MAESSVVTHRRPFFGSGLARVQKGGLGASDGPPSPPAKGLGQRVGDRLAQEVQAAWPDHPEWVAMLVDILKGSQLGPSDGWFPKAVAQTRYDWISTRRRLDRGPGTAAGRAALAHSRHRPRRPPRH